MEKKINNELIRSFNYCYDPIEVNIQDGESLPVKDWIEKYWDIVKNKEDIVWLICRPEFMSDKDCRLFAVWCARQALRLIPEPDERSVNACNVAEKYANGQATIEELGAAWAAARVAARAAVWATGAARAAWAAAWAAAGAAGAAGAAEAAWAAGAAGAAEAAGAALIDQLLTYFK